VGLAAVARLAEWKPRPLDRDRASRIGYGAAIVGANVGALILANPSLLLDHAFGGRAAPEAYAAFAYDDGFARTLGLALLVVLDAHLLLLATPATFTRGCADGSRTDV
jgi:hypothetical protein